MEQHILAVCLAFIIVCWGQLTTSMDPSAEILESPGNQTLPVNSTAVFTCTAAGFLFWRFSHPFDTTLQNIPIVLEATEILLCSRNKVCINGTIDESPDVTISQLLITATRDNNGSKIQCSTANEPSTIPSESSDPVFLTVYGHPDPPTSFTHLLAGQLQVKLSWDTSVAIPEVESTYIVHISNLNQSNSVESDELSTTHYIFTGTEEAKCDVYQFSVVALNDAGRSEPSTKITTKLPTLPDITASMYSLRHTVDIEDGQAFISISFEPTGTCPDYPVSNYSIVLHSNSTDIRWYELNAPADSGKIEIELGPEERIDENVQYSFSIMAVNSIGNVISNITECYTTDVQEARISMNGDNVVVSCDFARGSQALGCQIQLHSPMENITLNISRDDACGVVIKPSHSPILYEICALDWESDDTIGELCIPVTVNLSQVTSCADPPGPEPSSPKSQLVIGVIIGGIVGFLLVLIALVAAILLVSCYCMRAKRVRAKGNDYGDGCNGVSGKYKKGVHVEEIPSYHPTATERSDSQATTVTMLPPLPVYDAIQNYSRQDVQDCEEKDYSSLARGSQLTSPTPRADFTHDPQYSALNQVPTYAVLESNSVPLGILPHQEAYCEIDDLKRHESTAVAVSDADTSMVPENERLYSEIPSAGLKWD